MPPAMSPKYYCSTSENHVKQILDTKGSPLPQGMPMRDIAVLSLVSAAVSFFLSEAKITSVLRRGWGRSLFSCGYCIGHWVSLALALWFGVSLFGSTLLGWIVMAWLSGVQWAFMRFVTEE
jgi:hypothetical protein